MRKLGLRVVDFLKREDGPTAVEYAVMLALIIVVCLAAITTLGSEGARVDRAGEAPVVVGPVKDVSPLDPTGSGDGFRAI